jgi:peptide deformylase
MSVREIATVGHPVLRNRAREVSADELHSAEVQRLIDDMIDTMRAAGGAGLAANQVHEHEVDHLDGVLFLDRVPDPTTFTTWEQFDRHHREPFVARIGEFVERVGS